MVENINKLPDLMDYEDPDFLKSKGLYRVPEKAVNSLANKHNIEMIKKKKVNTSLHQKMEKMKKVAKKKVRRNLTKKLR